MAERLNLLCGDCLEQLKNIPNGCIDLIVTDPPYEITEIHGGGTVNDIKKLNKSLKDLETADIIKGYDIEQYNKEFCRVMKEINIYLWCNKRQIPSYFDFYVNRLKCKFDIICWHKTNALPTYSNKYLSDTEYCLYFRKGKGKCFPVSYESAKTYYVEPMNVQDKKKWGHPTIKPLHMIENFVLNSSREGDCVLDPFMGSGTTGVACVLNNRKFIGIEVNEEYYNVARTRIQEAEEGVGQLQIEL